MLRFLSAIGLGTVKTNLSFAGLKRFNKFAPQEQKQTLKRIYSLEKIKVGTEKLTSGLLVKLDAFSNKEHNFLTCF